MRRKFIAGNWKMNLDRKAAVALAEAVAREAEKFSDVDLAVCPPACYLDAVGQAIRGSRLALGAQNVYFEPNGAFTGEISVTMPLRPGGQVCHSRPQRAAACPVRRPMLWSSRRLSTPPLQAGLLPILCVGELLSEREAGKTMDVIRTQFEGSLAGVSAGAICLKKMVIAYEPVWAIGTGKVATPEQAEEVHLALRKLMAERYNEEIAQSMPIQYGGSVKPDNARELLGQADIDGALVGGASLNADQFLGIVAGAK